MSPLRGDSTRTVEDFDSGVFHKPVPKVSALALRGGQSLATTACSLVTTSALAGGGLSETTIVRAVPFLRPVYFPAWR